MKTLFKKVRFMTLAIPMLLLGIASGASAQSYHPEEVTIEYHCQSTINFNMEATIQSLVPDSVGPGEDITFLDSRVTVELPPLVVLTLRTLPYFAHSITGEVNTFNISDNNNVPVNVADPSGPNNGPIPIPNTSVPSIGNSMSFTVQGTGPNGIIAGPFTADNSGVMTFTAGNIDTVITTHSNLVGSHNVNASCSPTSTNTLTTVPIIP